MVFKNKLLVLKNNDERRATIMAERKKTTESLIALVAMEYEPEAAEAMAFVSELEQKEKEDFLSFLEGVRFGKRLAQKSA